MMSNLFLPQDKLSQFNHKTYNLEATQTYTDTQKY